MPPDGGPARLEAAIFDIGGVLELTPPTGWQGRWADALDLPREELERRLNPLWTPGELGHSSLEEIERATAERLELDPSQLDALSDDIWGEYLGSPNPELIAYFTALRPRLRTGILSNSLVGARELEQEAYGFEDLCDIVVYSHEEGMAKPDPRFYELACSRLECDPSGTVFVDDRAICVEGAERVGLRAIRHVRNEQTIAELDALLRPRDLEIVERCGTTTRRLSSGRMTGERPRPSAAALSERPDRAELREAVRRDRISWWPEDIYLAGVDGPFERRTTKEGALVLWDDRECWSVAFSRGGQVDREHRRFRSEAEACRWVYDFAYLDRYRSLGEEALIHLERAGPAEAAVAVRTELRLIDEELARLMAGASGPVGPGPSARSGPPSADLGPSPTVLQVRHALMAWPGFSAEAVWNPSIDPVDEEIGVGGHGDGTNHLMHRDGRWIVALEEHGNVGGGALVFDSEAQACRWVYDQAYFQRFASTGTRFADHLDRVGAPRMAAKLRSEWERLKAEAEREVSDARRLSEDG